MDFNEQDENFFKRKKLLMQINSGELNNILLFYINEARSSPKDFSRHLMVDDDVDEIISQLSLFFKYTSKEVEPLVLNKNLEKSTQTLLSYIISIDDGSAINFSKEEKKKNCLGERLKKFNLIPISHIELLIIGADNPIDAISNLLLNKNYRNKILNPDMKFIGIASGMLPSERLCIAIDIVHSLKLINNFSYNYRLNTHNYIKYKEDEDHDYNDEEEYCKKKNKMLKLLNNYSTNYSKNSRNKRSFYPKSEKKVKCRKIFKTEGVPLSINTNNNFKRNRRNHNFPIYDGNEGMDLRITEQTTYTRDEDCYDSPKSYPKEYLKEYKIPMSVSIEKNYARNICGNYFPFYSKQTKYDDGSILIQPYPED
jgi:hypothetical protein